MCKCLCPSHITINNQKKIVPCGKCALCRDQRSNMWSFRMKKQMMYERDTFGIFVTLTYNDENLPRSNFGCVTLRRRDFQLFMKRFRKQIEVPLKVIYCGEYGESTNRPHYHAVISGFPVSMCFHELQKLVEDCWHHGFVLVKACDGEVAKYVTKYSLKDLSRDALYYEQRGMEKPFRQFSRGIGLEYFKVNEKQIKKDGFCRDGKFKVLIPKYFKDKFMASKKDKLEDAERLLRNQVKLLKDKGFLDKNAMNNVDYKAVCYGVYHIGKMEKYIRYKNGKIDASKIVREFQDILEKPRHFYYLTLKKLDFQEVDCLDRLVKISRRYLRKTRPSKMGIHDDYRMNIFNVVNFEDYQKLLNYNEFYSSVCSRMLKVEKLCEDIYIKYCGSFDFDVFNAAMAKYYNYQKELSKQRYYDMRAKGMLSKGKGLV